MTGNKFRDVTPADPADPAGDKVGVPDVTQVTGVSAVKAGSVEAQVSLRQVEMGLVGGARGIPASDLREPTLTPLAVSYKRAGELIDRSSRTIRRMVDRGELLGLQGQALVSYPSLVDWVEQRLSSTHAIVDEPAGASSNHRVTS